MDIPEGVAGLAEHAKIAFGAMLGGMIRLYHRPGKTLVRSICLIGSSTACGVLGWPAAAHMLGWSPFYSAGLMGLVGLSLATGLLKAADKADLAHWFGRKELP